MSIGATTGVAAPLAPVVREAAEATPLVQDGIDAAPVTTHAVETAALQTLVRPDSARADNAPRAHEQTPAAADTATDLTLPAVQLVPVTLIGLAVDPEVFWNLPRDPTPREDVKTNDAPGADGAPLDWRIALARALRQALTAPEVPEALTSALAEWQRGRWVALACPQGADPVGPAWLFLVLWSDRAATPDGLRLAGRLRWFARPAGAQWLHTRLVKHFHPQRGRELSGPIDPLTGRAPCAIQFGGLMPAHRADATVRVDAGREIWSALQTQWSVVLAVSAMPLGDAS